MKTICFGLLIVFFCNGEQPATVSDCQLFAKEIAELRKLSPIEAHALMRPRLVAINSLKRKQKELCAAAKRQ